MNATTKPRKTTVAQGRPSRATQPQFQRIDPAAIAEPAREKVVRRLERTTDSLARLKKAVKLIADLEPRVEDLRRERDELALSATVYDGVRAIYTGAGISRNMLVKLKHRLQASAPDRTLLDAAKASGLPHREDWIEALPRVAQEWVVANAELGAAREIRNELVRDLMSRGELRAVEAAEIIGTNQTRISLLKAQATA